MKDWIKAAAILFGIVGGFVILVGLSMHYPIYTCIGTACIFVVGCLLMYNDK
jgi:multidrug transporter EmrE-like cation transporter